MARAVLFGFCVIKVINANMNHACAIPLAEMKARAACFTHAPPSELGAQVLAGLQIWNNNRRKNVSLTATAGPTASRLFKRKRQNNVVNIESLAGRALRWAGGG